MEYSAYSLLFISLIILAFAHPSLSSVATKAKITGFTFDVIPIYDLHMIKLKIGTPPTDAYAIVETGSDIVSFNCTPCENCTTQQGIPSYDPNDSTSYSHPDDRNSTACQSLLAFWHEKVNTCRYLYWYQEGYSYGVISREKIYIPLGSNGGGQIASYPNFLFGCGLDNDMRKYNKYHVGIVGLNMGPSSLISQLGIQKFSYCLSPPASSNSSGKMMFGDDVVSDGSVTGVVTTPIVKTNGEFYYSIKLEGATVIGAKSKIYIPNQGNNIDYYSSTVILSTGVTPTLLMFEFYYNLKAAMKNATDLIPADDSELCYNKYPEIEVVFHFTGGADVTLKPLNLFMKDYRGLLCFWMFPVHPPRDDYDNFIGDIPSGDDITIPLWGNLAQLNFQVTYDIANKLVSFAPTDCAKL